MLTFTTTDDTPALRKLARAARDGMRLTYQPDDAPKAKTLWAGLGNRSGLHSFADTLCRDKWDKSGERFLKRLRKLPAGTVITVHDYHNTNRDRGRWHPAFRVTL